MKHIKLFEELFEAVNTIHGFYVVADDFNLKGIGKKIGQESKRDPEALMILSKGDKIIVNITIGTEGKRYNIINTTKKKEISTWTEPDFKKLSLIGTTADGIGSIQDFPKLDEAKKDNEYITVYHGTNSKFENFDLDKATQGIIWFSDNKETIESGESGAHGNKYILKRRILLKNPAGWDEYEKYSLQELRERGYDGVILKSSKGNDYIVFNTRSIKK